MTTIYLMETSMPEWLQLLLKAFAENPAALAEIIKLINRILDLFDKNPELLAGITKTLNK